MGAVTEFWGRQNRGGKTRLILGIVLIAGLTAALAFWTLRTPYDVLFSQLTDADAASITEQLKRQKTPYRLADNGATITVPAAIVHESRLRLMSSGVSLAGGVGFELFDKQGLGATEQSQRVSYQRALQGELARTIGSLDGVKQARIHLVLPESTLFKRDREEARAAVTLTLKPGAELDRERISGIQRLVAASVAGLEPGKVVVTDQRGIVLTVADALAKGAGVSDARLQMKREIEEYVTRKVARLLDGTFGPGQAIVSVDVALNFDEITRTVRDLLPVRAGAGASGGSPGGVDNSAGVRRRRQIQSSSGAGGDGVASDAASTAAPTNASTEVEYEYGQRVEQVIAAPGGITRLSIGVVVPGDLSVERQQRISDLVRMAAGVNEDRGDAVIVQALDQLGAHPAAAAVEVEQAVTTGASEFKPPVSSKPVLDLRQPTAWLPWAPLAAGVVLLIVVLLGWRRSAQSAGPFGGRSAEPLSAQERHELLLEVQRALGEEQVMAEQGAKP